LTSCYIQIAVHRYIWFTLNQENKTLVHNVLLVICQAIQHDSMIVDVVVNQTSESLHSNINRIGAVMVNVLAYNAIYCGLELQSGQTKYHNHTDLCSNALS
jgi:hypothetical protein